MTSAVYAASLHNSPTNTVTQCSSNPLLQLTACSAWKVTNLTQSGSLTAVTSVLFGGTERVGPHGKTPLGHSQITVYCQSQQTAVRDREFQRVCGRWLAGSEGLSGRLSGVDVFCCLVDASERQRTLRSAVESYRVCVCVRVFLFFL